MKAVVVRAPGGIDRLEVVNRPNTVQPGPGEIRVALKTSSLDYHDYAVVGAGVSSSGPAASS